MTAHRGYPPLYPEHGPYLKGFCYYWEVLFRYNGEDRLLHWYQYIGPEASEYKLAVGLASAQTKMRQTLDLKSPEADTKIGVGSVTLASVDEIKLISHTDFLFMETMNSLWTKKYPEQPPT